MNYIATSTSLNLPRFKLSEIYEDMLFGMICYEYIAIEFLKK